MIAEAGVLAFLTTMGHFPGVAVFLHLSAIPAHTLWIVGVIGMTGGSVVALFHGGILTPMKKFGQAVLADE